MTPPSIINMSVKQENEQEQGTNTENNINKNSISSSNSNKIPSVSAASVLVESVSLPSDTPQCRGHDFSIQPRTLDALLQSMLTTGFQATNLSLAIDQINQMRAWRLSDTPYNEATDDPSLACPRVRQRIRARIFLAFTSNQISSGQREIIRYLVQHKMVDVLITTAGGIEEDLIKCLQPTYIGDFSLKGRDLRRQGINRIGNLLVPNQNYCDFEDWVAPILHQMHDEQDQATQRYVKEAVAASVQRAATTTRADHGDKVVSEDEEERFVWTPSKVIERLGNEINHPDSVLYWAAKNQIPVFCPALTDGSLGDMLYFHSYKRPGLVLDLIGDIRRLNDLAVRSHGTGQIILGGGLVKHHCCNAQLMRNGADFSVYVNTASDYDGSDSGASPDEAVSWGKIRLTAKPVKVTGDATILFPLIVSQTFAKGEEAGEENLGAWKKRVQDTVCWVDDL